MLITTQRIALRDPHDPNARLGTLFLITNRATLAEKAVVAPAFVQTPLDGADQAMCDAIQQTTGHWPRLLGWHPVGATRLSFLTWYCDVCACDVAEDAQATTARAGAWVCEACAEGWDEMQRAYEEEDADAHTP